MAAAEPLAGEGGSLGPPEERVGPLAARPEG